ncbi:MAG: tetratricopeptide repeat protein [Bdellovibrionales bacterium]
MNKLFLLIFCALLSLPAGAQTQSTLSLEAQLKAKPDDILIREQAARAHAKSKNWQKVVDLLNPHTDEATARGFLQLAAAYQELKDYANLVRVMNLLAEKRPKDAHIQYLLGDARLKAADEMKDLKPRQTAENEAIDNFRTALRLKRSFKPAHQALVNYFLKVNMNHEAREQILDMIKVFGSRGDFHAELCRLYSNDGFLPQAIKFCNKAIQISPNAPESYVYLAQTYFDQKELEKSEEALIRAAKKFQNSEFVQYGAGQFFLTSGNYPVAARYLQRAVASDANSSRSRISYANALFGSGQMAQSLPHFIKACELNSASQGDFLAAASKLRLKGETVLAQKFAQAAGGCKKN